MPYIKEENRLGARVSPRTAGDLNYAVTNLVRVYLSGRDLNYQLINDVVGALEGAKQEFYRRVAIPYEEEKIKQNGDVY